MSQSEYPATGHSEAVGVEITSVSAQDSDIVTRFEPAIRRFCRSRTRNREDAEDAVQDTFLRYLRRSDKPIRNHLAWLLTAASRACANINQSRRREDQRRMPPSIRDGEYVDLVATLSDSQHRADPEEITIDHLVVKSLLRKLPERERVVITHVYLLGASHRQVAQYLGVSDTAVRMIAMRARRHVRALVQSAKDSQAV